MKIAAWKVLIDEIGAVSPSSGEPSTEPLQRVSASYFVRVLLLV